MNSSQSFFVESHWCNQRLDRKETDIRRRSLQVCDSPFIFLILNGDTKPHVQRPICACEILIRPFFEPFSSLREHLKRVMLRSVHRVEYTANEIVRYVFVEQIRHGIHENSTRFFPMKWEFDSFRPQF